MAVASCARSVFRSPSVRRAAAKLAAAEARAARSSSCPFHLLEQRPPPRRFFRSPMEMSRCVESLLPLHSATSSALLTSMLALSCRTYYWLSEGQDETR